MSTLIASAGRLTSTQMQDSSFRRSAAVDQQWQQDAWSMYDLVGELRFLVDTMAARTSRAKLYVATLEGTDDAPVIVEDQKIQDILLSIGNGPVGLSRLLERLVANLKVTGDGWLAGIPASLMPELDEGEMGLTSTLPSRRAAAEVRDEDEDNNSGSESLQDYRWFMLSVSEIQFHQSGKVVIQLGPADADKLNLSVDDVHLVRVWKPHPQFSWQADSGTRAGLPVLRELVGLTMHISAQIDSRLAGAGLLIVPASAARAVKRSMGLPDDSEEDPFTDALIMSMLTPISDRASASAVVPLVLTVPDEATDKFNYMNFDKPLDSEARAMREEAIKRFALGADAPPELLMGNADMNHWNGWLTREDVISNHIEPVLGLVCDALTSQFLRPVLKDSGIEDVEKYVIWYDVQHLTVQNNRNGDAKDLYDRDAISDEALRRANGFDEEDAPAKDDSSKRASEAVLRMVESNPGLIRSPGIPALVEQLTALLEGKPIAMARTSTGAPQEIAGSSVSSTAPVRSQLPAGTPAKEGSSVSSLPKEITASVSDGLRIRDIADYELKGSLSKELESDESFA